MRGPGAAHAAKTTELTPKQTEPWQPTAARTGIVYTQTTHAERAFRQTGKAPQRNGSPFSTAAKNFFQGMDEPPRILKSPWRFLFRWRA